MICIYYKCVDNFYIRFKLNNHRVIFNIKNFEKVKMLYNNLNENKKLTIYNCFDIKFIELHYVISISESVTLCKEKAIGFYFQEKNLLIKPSIHQHLNLLKNIIEITERIDYKNKNVDDLYKYLQNIDINLFKLNE